MKMRKYSFEKYIIFYILMYQYKIYNNNIYDTFLEK